MFERTPAGRSALPGPERHGTGVEGPASFVFEEMEQPGPAARRSSPRLIGFAHDLGRVRHSFMPSKQGAARDAISGAADTTRGFCAAMSWLHQPPHGTARTRRPTTRPNARPVARDAFGAHAGCGADDFVHEILHATDRRNRGSVELRGLHQWALRDGVIAPTGGLRGARSPKGALDVVPNEAREARWRFALSNSLRLLAGLNGCWRLAQGLTPEAGRSFDGLPGPVSRYSLAALKPAVKPARETSSSTS